MNILHAWMSAQRDLLPEGSAISRALDYSLKRWAALSRYIDDGAVSIPVAIASLYELNSRRVTGSTMTIQTPHDTGDQKRNRRNFM
ncbi:Transposase IS66 family protein [Pseudomonas salomonii]|uniref:Transposase IS66 family protein n=1 Tax=Pseudomonas salomonii TaxID=191391 RepID=A0A1H3UHC1_9PSED|nr:Transposase IS66 family protein [Pseudomonas sp. 58 R 3]SDZ61794.1 Transposase IS66 family protein [Pseudomonas salomonii]